MLDEGDVALTEIHTQPPFGGRAGVDADRQPCQVGCVFAFQPRSDQKPLTVIEDDGPEADIK